MSLGNNVGLVISIAVPCLLIYWVFHTGSIYEDFKKNGVRTTAKVTNIKQIATSSTGALKCIFTLSFTTEDNVRVLTKKTDTLSSLELMPLERNGVVDIYYKKDNPKRVWIISGSEN